MLMLQQELQKKSDEDLKKKFADTYTFCNLDP